MTRYQITVTREDDAWLATADSVAGVHTWARSLSALEHDVREAIALALDLPDGAEADMELEVVYDVGDPSVAAAASLGALRKLIEEQDLAAARRVPSVVTALAQAGYSVRDISVLLAMSPGRVSQITTAVSRDRANDQRDDVDDSFDDLNTLERSQSVLVRDTLKAFDSKVADLENGRTKLRQDFQDSLRDTAAALSRAFVKNHDTVKPRENHVKAIAETAGVAKHLQMFATSDGGPDALLQLPGGKSIAIQSKLPWLDLASGRLAAPSAVRAHVKSLGDESHWASLKSRPEMIMVCLPSEASLQSLLDADSSILEFAFARQVAIASPVTLIAVFKAVRSAWDGEALSTETQQVADAGRNLYGQLTSFAEYVERANSGKHLWKRRRKARAG